MNDINSSEIFKQIRMSHRITVAYYKRLFQLLTDITNDERLGLSFYTWGPSQTNRPCKLSSNVFDNWEWDLVPGIATNYLFYTAKDSNAQVPGEWLIDINVISDTGAVYDEIDGNKDPLELHISPEDAKSVVRCNLLTIRKSMTVNWYKNIWGSTEYPVFTNEPEIQCADENENIHNCGFEMSLEKLTGEDASEIMVTKIIEYRDALLNYVANSSKY